VNQHNTDDDWLRALAGQPRSGADGIVTHEALAVRRALAAMRREAAERAQEVDAVRERREIERTLFALKREGLLTDAPSASTGAQRTQEAAAGNNGPRRSRHWYGNAWAIAASILVVTAIGLQIPYEDDESWDRRSMAQRIAQGDSGPLVRGGGTETVILSQNPRQRADELVAGLTRAGARVEVKPSKRGEVLLRIQSSQPALDFLYEQRLTDPQITDGWVYLRIAPVR
jgi:hypothetical protein